MLEAQEWPLAEADKISELLLEECSAYGWYEVIAFDADLSDAAAVHDWVHDSGSVVVDRLPDDDETLVIDGHCYQIRSELYAVANELIQIRTKLIECLGGHAIQN